MELDVFTSQVFNKHIDSILLANDFYKSTMRPRFMNGCGWDDLILDSPVLRRDKIDSEGYIVRLFVNKVEFYVERETPWRSLSDSYRLPIEVEIRSAEDVKELIDELLDWI